MKPLQISAPASLELAEAVRWYEERRPRWGPKLFDAVSHTFDLVEHFPESGSPRRRTARQLAVRGFPFIVVYRVRPDDVYVIACRPRKLKSSNRRPSVSGCPPPNWPERPFRICWQRQMATFEPWRRECCGRTRSFTGASPDALPHARRGRRSPPRGDRSNWRRFRGPGPRRTGISSRPTESQFRRRRPSLLAH